MTANVHILYVSSHHVLAISMYTNDPMGWFIYSQVDIILKSKCYFYKISIKREAKRTVKLKDKYWKRNSKLKWIACLLLFTQFLCRENRETLPRWAWESFEAKVRKINKTSSKKTKERINETEHGWDRDWGGELKWMWEGV